MRSAWTIPGVLGLGALAAICWLERPFRMELARVPSGIASRSNPERRNLAQAVRKVDGAVLNEGGRWSLDRCLGTRTVAGGYLPAPVLRGGARELDPGGGICQLASAVFQAALVAGLDIEERHGHGRPITSAPSGLDATLWEGVRDLVLVNRGPGPVRFRAGLLAETLLVTLSGEPGRARVRLLTREWGRDRTDLRLVETARWRDTGHDAWNIDWADRTVVRR